MPNKGGALAALAEAKQGRSDDECWPWTRYGMKKTGYGQTSYEGKAWLAHRLAFVLAGGEIPPGHVIDHECHTRVRETCTDGPDCPHRLCVNPGHLRVVTRAVNALDGNSPLSHHARQTHCGRGHPLTGDNVRIVLRKGRAPSRECKECRRQANRAAYYRNDERTKQRERYAARKRNQGAHAAYSVGSSRPASANASRRSTQVPHVPQCTSPPL